MLNTPPLRNVAGMIMACSALNAFAAPGDLDTTFATGGKFQTPVGGAYGSSVGGVILQSDGRIFIGGEAWNDATNNYDFALVRLTADGELDTTYDTDGKAMFPIGLKNDNGYSMALSPTDNSFVIVGAAGNATFTKSDFAVARFNSDGTLDTDFDTDGKATTYVEYDSRNDASDAVIQSDGKILVAGSAYIGNSPRIGVVRFLANGSLDPDFDADGRLLINPGN